ncbi:glycosyltransferase family 4 protein [Brumimicrobium mesophilum]|uniref:glycosyltransferase family 4 protein n=1 Tax=Brumimicrobium mesophilum TaxID=392717 RepID=UPI000D140FF8|nr:glycosyltransferase family 4 protein [Brumimicrobium mesophilum]
MKNQGNRIAYFCPSLSWGGLEMTLLKNASWMRNKGHNVMIIAQHGSRIHQESELLDIDVDFVQQHRKYYDFIKASRLVKILRQHQITHLVFRDPKDMSICALAKTLMFNKLFLAYFTGMQLGIAKRDFLHTLRFSKLDLWSCLLPWLKKQVNELTRFPEEKTKVIPPGLVLNKFFNAPSASEAKVLLALDANKKYIGLVGRFDEQKRQLLLLEAFSKIKSEIEHNLVFLGESTHGESDAYFNKLKDFVSQNNMEKRVHFVPFRNDVETFYAAIDVFVMATNSETFGMVTIEAMASGCKIVGSNKGGTVEILKHGELGELFESGNSDDLASKILIAINDENFDTNRNKEAAKEYDAEKFCDNVEKALGL